MFGTWTWTTCTPAGSFGGSQATSDGVSHFTGHTQAPIFTVLPEGAKPAPCMTKGRSRSAKTAPPFDEVLCATGVYRVSLPAKVYSHLVEAQFDSWYAMLASTT